jgi:ligand-binding sensor domain-containing protein
MNRFYLFFFLLFTAKLSAQELFFSPPANFQNLPSFETYDVLQDHKGFIWITTDAGICRYDGAKLTVFTVKEGIDENVVFKAYEDVKARIWFNTLSGYFFYYENNTFHSIAANEQLKKICNAYPVSSFYIGEKDTLYCSTVQQTGIIKIPPQNNYRDVIRDTTGIIKENRFLVTNKLHPEECIVGKGLQLAQENDDDNYTLSLSYNKKTVSFKIREEDRFLGNYFICKIDIHKNIYFPTGKQLNVITEEGKVKQYYFPQAILNCYLDKDNDLWVCTERKGGYLYKNGDLSKPPVRFLTSASVSSIRIDREGTIWATTLDKGIFQSMNKRLLCFNEKEDKATYLQKDYNRLNISYASKKIISIYKNDSICVNDGLRKILNFTTDLSTVFLDERYQYYTTTNAIFMLDSKKPGALLKLNGRTMVTEILKTGEDSILFLSAPFLTTFYKGKQEVIITPFPNRSILQLKNKKILISSRNNNGIYEFKNNNFIRFLVHLPQLQTRINSMLEDKFGNLWIATNEHGLYCYDMNQKLHQYTTINNLICDKINSLAIDEKNNLWIASYNGLTKLSYTKELQNIGITNFNKSHGIPNLQIDKLIYFNGKIACISKENFFYFEATELKKNTTPPLSYIESVSINDEPYNVKDIPVLSYDKKNLHIQTSLIAYKNTQQQRFIYKLIGYDKNWHYSATGDIQYTNLPHGKYDFTIYGLNNDNLRSNDPATFSFIIKKPFWLTWWFIKLEIIVFSALIYLIFKFWKNKIEKREHAKTLINQKIAEFKMTALRSQMNPHFVFNAISSIQHYILKQDTFKSYNYLAKFSLLIRTILDNSKEEYIAISQEINTLKLYIELEQIRFKQPFQFILDIDEKLDLETHIPTMLIQPYVENSIWHGLMPKKTNCILHLLLKKEEQHIFVSIKDNGVGRDKSGKTSDLHVSKGMSLTEQRIKELELSNGKKFSVHIIDLTDDKGNPTGTEVQLIIPFDL